MARLLHIAAENENLKAELTKAKEEKESHRLVLREVQVRTQLLRITRISAQGTSALCFVERLGSRAAAGRAA